MLGAHPKRKKDKSNPYTLYVQNDTYYISFVDGEGIYREERISVELYNEFNSYELEDISRMNEVARHLVELDMSEESLYPLCVNVSESLEDCVCRRILHKDLHNAIAQLPEIQRRRILLYYFGGYTYEKIAELEGCKHPAIIKSVTAAEKKIKKYLSMKET